ncbi:PadR family transcriptional regulator [Streptomyces anandii]|uniref:PadR family transcriptional regulator n=1 Tax=Streptomyces anandii TaxID=285454 RepID=UPI00167596AA|nr:helix-turn-helix transcriptional regulator [Streptomyces anandii]GGX93678.1 transcriptional regulator [Streptomyces anandii JCM 4720]
MSLRHGLLALLEEGPAHGSLLRTAYAARTGAQPPALGRVHTALGRLERDGMVVREGVDEAGRGRYALTGAGRAELRDWYARPARREGPPCDEFVLKLVLAVRAVLTERAPDADVRQIVETRRRQVSGALHDYVRQRAEVLALPPERPAELARLLVLEQSISRAEAEARWLDHCEARLLRLHVTDGAEGPPGTVDHPARGAPRR